MLKDISKKLTMKKTFFVTQLEGFFNSISQEYQEIIYKLEVENRLLEEKNSKLEKDIANLISIRKNLTKELEIDQQRLEDATNTKAHTHYNRLLKENEDLKNRLTELTSTDNKDELELLKQKNKNLQHYISKGANAYTQNIMDQKSEDIIKEIQQNLSKD
jgi:hypothetical protein